MSERHTMTEIVAGLASEGGSELMIRAAVARALQNYDGRWRTDDQRDAADVAEAACHFFLDEIKRALKEAERLRAFVRDSNTRR